MREYKFRAWDKKNKVMIPFSDGYISEEYSSICWRPSEESEYLGIGSLPGSYDNLSKKIEEQYELMQYTGLKDKHGKDIYEGDVIDHEGEIGIVEFEDAGFIIKFEDECFIPGYNWHIEETEVIGNIWESPELTEK